MRKARQMRRAFKFTIIQIVRGIFQDELLKSAHGERQ